MMSGSVLIIDDEADMRLGLSETLSEAGYQVDTAGDGWTALERVRTRSYDLVMVDLKMPGPDGMAVLDAVQQVTPQTPVVVITGFATVASAVEAMKRGACDYLAKPFKLDYVRLVVRRVIERKQLEDENRRLKQTVARYEQFEQIVGQSLCMQAVFQAIDQVAHTSSTVLICGETGTGKDLLARALHRRSPRADGAFVAVSCGAIAESLLEDALFGHVRGAFTGAHADREGVFEAADGGTLFLDEIGDIPTAMQMKLLRVLQAREIQRVGEVKRRSVDVRLVAATHKDLKAEVQAGRFREDLYYRIDVVRVNVPPLRERREDIPLLVMHFIKKYSQEIGKDVSAVAPDAMKMLMQYHWPGNVRELQNAIERGIIWADGPVLRPEHLPLDRGAAPEPGSQDAGRSSLREVERHHILRVLQGTGFNQTQTADILGIGRRTLYRKIREYGIALPDAEATHRDAF